MGYRRKIVMLIETDADILDLLSEVGGFSFDSKSYDINEEQMLMLKENNISFIILNQH